MTKDESPWLQHRRHKGEDKMNLKEAGSVDEDLTTKTNDMINAVKTSWPNFGNAPDSAKN